jgi:hypothetical protein
MLLYPSTATKEIKEDDFVSFDNSKHACSLGKICIFNNEGALDHTIGKTILEWYIPQIAQT